MSHRRFRPGLRLPAAAVCLFLGTAASLSLLASCGTQTDSGDNTATTAAVEKTPPASAPGMTPAQRGEYLVTVGACNDCHTPFIMGPEGPAPDMSRMLSGHPQDMEMPPPPAPSGPWIWMGDASNTAFAGPWGISYSANLTPDQRTGTGSWTEEWFIASLRTGKHWGTGRDIQPPMPWSWYANFTDEDLKAIFAYLKSIPPVENLVPAWVPPTGGGAPGEQGGEPKKS